MSGSSGLHGGSETLPESTWEGAAVTARPSPGPASPRPERRDNRRAPADWPGGWEEFQAARARFLARLAAERVLREVSATVVRSEGPARTR
jgi:hypothetical protein